MQLPAAVTEPAILNGIAAGRPNLPWAVGTENVPAAGSPLLLQGS
jgi:hypothetical protein